MRGNKEKPNARLAVLLTMLTVTALFAAVLYFTDLYPLKPPPKLNYTHAKISISPPPYPDAAFAVISDTHIHHPSLGVNGAAFDAAMANDRKMWAESIELLNLAKEDIAARGVEFVIVTGDLTKDGEAANHAVAAEILQSIANIGISVYVVPGNHDVNNPYAAVYSGSEILPTDTVTPDEFAEIYANFGYNDAIMRDPHSLSYIAEPKPGLWLLALDSCRYDQNTEYYSAPDGGFRQETVDWIAESLTEAARRNIAVAAFMHHGVAEHWKGRASAMPNYIIDDYENFGRFLASYNCRIVFTGHYHEQSHTIVDFNNGEIIHDIGTGSVVTPPCPVRYVTFDNNSLISTSNPIILSLTPDYDLQGHNASLAPLIFDIN